MNNNNSKNLYFQVFIFNWIFSIKEFSQQNFLTKLNKQKAKKCSFDNIEFLQTFRFEIILEFSCLELKQETFHENYKEPIIQKLSSFEFEGRKG